MAQIARQPLLTVVFCILLSLWYCVRTSYISIHGCDSKAGREDFAGRVKKEDIDQLLATLIYSKYAALGVDVDTATLNNVLKTPEKQEQFDEMMTEARNRTIPKLPAERRSSSLL